MSELNRAMVTEDLARARMSDSDRKAEENRQEITGWNRGTGGKIGKKEIGDARDVLNKYKGAKATIDRRIIENELWWRMQHLHIITKDQRRETDTPSGWLFNAIANKHADAMDNYPEASVRPREQGDKQSAETLSSILPVILERNEFEDVYSKGWTYKLKSGTGCYGVFWNSRKMNGLGDIEIRRIDLLRLFWEPRIEDIQDSRNIFYVYETDTDLLEEEYPETKGKLGEHDTFSMQYVYEDGGDRSNKTAVIDWYYKKRVGNRDVLHYVKFTGDFVLYATENDPALAETGLYDHGLYPFVLDPMWHIEGSPAGFGFIDVAKGVMTRIDRLQNAITENAQEGASSRWMIPDGTDVNEEEFNDRRNRFVHVSGSLDDEHLRQIVTEPVASTYVSVVQNYIEELKEVIGNRDASQGGTTSGVTAASAIAAMIEAGSKLSRDVIKGGYRAFTKVCYLVIECIRQFYDEKREFRITGAQGEEQFVSFSNADMRGEDGREPIYDVVVKAQKANAYSRLSQNEMAKEFYGMGFFNPQNADQALATLDMMDFDGKDHIISVISQNGTMYQKLQQAQQYLLKLGMIVDGQNGTQVIQEMQAAGVLDPAAVPQQQPGAQGNAAAGGDIQTNSLGAPMGTNNIVERAKANVAESTAVR